MRSRRMPRSIEFGAIPTWRWNACCSPRTLSPTCSATSVVEIGVWANACMYSTASRTRPVAPCGSGTSGREQAVRERSSAARAPSPGRSRRARGGHGGGTEHDRRRPAAPAGSRTRRSSGRGVAVWSNTSGPGWTPWSSAAIPSRWVRSNCTRLCRTSASSKTKGRPVGNIIGRTGSEGGLVATDVDAPATVGEPHHAYSSRSLDLATDRGRRSGVDRNDIVSSPTTRNRYSNGRSVAWCREPGHPRRRPRTCAARPRGPSPTSRSGIRGSWSIFTGAS